jgi:NAD(P)-dependent dehydrogenase (short-subunit alcohol dehydrogenase family)
MTQQDAPSTVIIGGTAGIGLATAQRLTADGHTVTVVGRDPDRLKRAVERIGADTARAFVADLCDRASLDALFTQVGALDHLVVTAPGNGSVGALAELDLGALLAAFDTKLVAAAHAIQAALPRLSRSGSITLVSAASAQSALPGTAGLAAVNGAVETMVPVLALELSPIRVNAVSPGVVDTDWWDRVVAPEQRQEVLAGFAGSIPVGRAGRPEEIADVIALLVRNGFMTGAVIPVDGGGRLKP